MKSVLVLCVVLVSSWAQEPHVVDVPMPDLVGISGAVPLTAENAIPDEIDIPAPLTIGQFHRADTVPHEFRHQGPVMEIPIPYPEPISIPISSPAHQASPESTLPHISIPIPTFEPMSIPSPAPIPYTVPEPSPVHTPAPIAPIPAIQTTSGKSVEAPQPAPVVVPSADTPLPVPPAAEVVSTTSSTAPVTRPVISVPHQVDNVVDIPHSPIAIPSGGVQENNVEYNIPQPVVSVPKPIVQEKPVVFNVPQPIIQVKFYS